jgi:multidrug efflux pump subunit AcrA (membrane-fusion protein)
VEKSRNNRNRQVGGFLAGIAVVAAAAAVFGPATPPPKSLEVVTATPPPPISVEVVGATPPPKSM